MRFFKDTKKYFPYAVYSAKAELKSEVANSYLNWIWWVLEPICTMLVYMLVFGNILPNMKEDYFGAFLFVGLTVWGFFNKNLVNSVKLVVNNKSIISKVYLPKTILILSKIMVNGFKMLINLGIVVILMIYYKVPVTIHVLEVFPLLVLLTVITYALMGILLHLGVFVEDMAYVISILLKLVYFLTGIFYNIDTKVKDDTLRYVLGVGNPIGYVIREMRLVILGGQGIDWTLYFIWLGIGLVCCFAVNRVIYKNENSYIKSI
ncbi:MAG: ABC transporter permease [Lachnospiraceae bacterium]|nr:ABC transporter permease [Lachnospiraceae bacterium]